MVAIAKRRKSGIRPAVLACIILLFGLVLLFSFSSDTRATDEAIGALLRMDPYTGLTGGDVGGDNNGGSVPAMQVEPPAETEPVADFSPDMSEEDNNAEGKEEGDGDGDGTPPEHTENEEDSGAAFAEDDAATKPSDEEKKDSTQNQEEAEEDSDNKDEPVSDTSDKPLKNEDGDDDDDDKDGDKSTKGGENGKKDEEIDSDAKEGKEDEGTDDDEEDEGDIKKPVKKTEEDEEDVKQPLKKTKANVVSSEGEADGDGDEDDDHKDGDDTGRNTNGVEDVKGEKEGRGDTGRKVLGDGEKQKKDSKAIGVSTAEGERALFMNSTDCKALLKAGYRTPGSKSSFGGDALNPNRDQIHARYIQKLQKPFWISLHHPELDNSFHDNIMKPVTAKGIEDAPGVYNQTVMTAVMEKIVSGTDKATFVDVGANVGWYSLLAKAHGATVVAFEPIPPNVFRLCESLFLNRWDEGISIYQAAVGDADAERSLLFEDGLQATITETKPEPLMTKWALLDDLAESKGWFKSASSSISLLKIHVDGLGGVLKSAPKLLEAKAVDNIVITLVTNEESGDWTKLLTDNGYKLHRWGHWTGPDQKLTDVQDAAALLSSESLPLTFWWKK